MQELDLKEFETKIHVRTLTMNDFDQLLELQKLCFPGMQTWGHEHIESQIRIFQDGQLCVEYEGRVVASASCLIVDFDHYEEWYNWKTLSDNGYIRNHNNDGDTLYGIEIMVHPEFRGLKLARRLYDARKEIARKKNLQRIIIGGRIPGYSKYKDEMSAREYVDHVINKQIIDPVLTAQLANGFNLKRLIPNYFPTDHDSCGYATFLEWTNLDYVDDTIRRFQAVSSVRLCIVQYLMRRISDFDEFAKQCEFFVDVGSDYKSDFVVFPELFTTQLLCLIDASRPAESARKLAEYTPDYLELFNDLAVRYNVNIIGGSQFAIEEDQNLYNIAYLFRRDGSIEKQYKIHITPNEQRWWGVQPGDSVEVFDTDRGKICILICYDIEFPELSRIAAAKGANIIFVPYNTDERYGYLRVRHCAQARAIENQMYVAISGCAGMMPFVDNADMHYAQCGVFTPSDFPFARDALASESMPNIETVVVHDIDIELIRRNRMNGTVRPWTDRRKDLYGIRYTDEKGNSVEI